MKSVRQWIRNVFGFSGNEINGFLILLPLMLVFIVSEPLYHAWVTNSPRPAEVRRLDSLISLWDNLAQNREPPVVLFPFDPNTASVSELVRLGVSESLANRIAAYRRKGGVFRFKSDLQRIYGLDSALYNRLYEYIALPVGPVREPRRANFPERRPGPSRGKQETREKTSFDINTADTLQLKSVYGIGPALSARIVRFRDALGGFVHTGQLFEVYGLDSATALRLMDVCFVKADFAPQKIDINTANEVRLSAHPYVSYRLARLLVSYRFQHGDFLAPADIKNISVVDSAEVDRLLPYLTVGEQEQE